MNSQGPGTARVVTDVVVATARPTHVPVGAADRRTDELRTAPSQAAQ